MISSINIQVDEIDYKLNRIGNGEEYFLFIHGFNQTKESFNELAFHLASSNANISILLLDLPFHGATQILKNNWTLTDMNNLVINLLNNFQIDKINIIGYSIGGRIALTFFEKNPALINNIILLAADGFYLDKFYLFSTNYKIGKKAFNYFTTNKKSLGKLAKIFKKLKLISERNYRFISKNIDNEEIFIKVNKIWPAFTDFHPNIPIIIDLINNYKNHTLIIMGKYDAIIAESPANNFSKMIPNNTYITLNAGHDFTNRKIQLEIADIINTFTRCYK